MRTVGIIAEYNPFHSGHAYHIREARRAFGPDVAVLCVMSGNWVQRGDAAVLDKWSRTAMALRGGADLVIELPTPWAMASAEGFAEGAVRLLQASGVVDALSFGSEDGALEPLLAAASCLDSDAYRAALRLELDAGLSFPVARQRAAESILGAGAACLRTPNNNLGIEYLRALNRLGGNMTASTVTRTGTSHDSGSPSPDFASASYLRKQLLSGVQPEALLPYLAPADAAALTPEHLASLRFATRAIFARLRCMSPADFAALPDCGEGLENLLSRAALETDNLDALYEAVKSKRYTHARIRRLVLAGFLGLRAADRPETPPYLRVLGMNAQGKRLLGEMKTLATLPVITKPSHVRRLDAEAQKLFDFEARCTALYDLCRAGFGDGLGKAEFTTNPLVF